jgi:hypothetical protein
MRRFLLLLINEFKLFRTAIPIHLVGILQPTLMFSLMALILVTPTFDMRIVSPSTTLEEDLLSAMQEVGSPIGTSYINPILVAPDMSEDFSGAQVVSVESRDGTPTAVQRFGLIDSNIVKNYRNRLTSAALLLWNESLGGYTVTVEQFPLLPSDVPYSVYFGMALQSLAAFMSAALIGSFLTAQEFEFLTIAEYRLSPVPMGIIIGARLLRLSLTGVLSAAVLMLAVGIQTGHWPSSLSGALLTYLAMAVLGGCVGTCAGLVLKSTLPSFVIGLTTAFATWILGGAFGLPAGFGGAYEAVSRWMPNTYAIDLLFPIYYPVDAGPRWPAALYLTTACAFMVLATLLAYRHNVLRREA